MKPSNIILECVVGSHMYNLNTPESDEDVKGVYVLPTKDLLGELDGYTKIDQVKDHTDPDWAYYEVQKLIKLVTSGNPTVTELLFANEYTVLTDIGQLLIDNRNAFLSKKNIRNAYVGYAYSQISKKQRNAGNVADIRKGKFLRHLWRLIKQYEQFAETGTLQPRLTDEERKECFDFEEFCRQHPSYAEFWFLKYKNRLEKVEAKLPEEPDYKKISEILLQIRRESLLSSGGEG